MLQPSIKKQQFHIQRVPIQEGSICSGADVHALSGAYSKITDDTKCKNKTKYTSTLSENLVLRFKCRDHLFTFISRKILVCFQISLFSVGPAHLTFLQLATASKISVERQTSQFVSPVFIFPASSLTPRRLLVKSQNIFEPQLTQQKNTRHNNGGSSASSTLL